MAAVRRRRDYRALAISAVAALTLAAAGCDRLPGAKKGGDAPGIGADGASQTPAGPPPAPTADQLGAAAAPEVQALFEGEFEAVGSEPFWRLDLFNDAANFTRPGLEPVFAVSNPRDYRTGGMFVEAGPLVVTLKAGACEHANGEVFPYVASVQFDGVAYDGCARRTAEGARAPTPSWSALLPELIPAIDSCLKRAGAEGGRVTIAYVIEGAQVNVRMVDSDGGRTECGVGEDGAISYFEAIGDRDILQGERDPIFTRTPGKPPEGKCWQNEEARGPGGDALGWLSRRVC
jgi:uncharacterized membrane protein